MKNLLIWLVAFSAVVYFLPAAAQPSPTKVEVKLGKDYKNKGVFNPDNNYFYIGSYNGENYYGSESVVKTHYYPHPRKHSYFKLNSDLTGELKEYADQDEGPDAGGADLISIGAYGFDQGRISQIYQDVEGKRGQYGLYRAVLNPDGSFSKAKSFPEGNSLATNLSYSWHHDVSDDGESHIIYGFSGREEGFKRYYSSVHIIITDHHLNALKQYSINLNSLPSGFVLDDLKLDNAQEIYLIGYDGRTGLNEDDPIKYRVFKLKGAGDNLNFKEIPLEFQDKFPSYAGVYTSNDGKTVIAGVYQNDKKEIQGIFHQVLAKDGSTIKSLTYTAFKENLEAARAAQHKNAVMKFFTGKDGSQYKLRKVHLDETGARYLVFEDNFEWMEGQPGLFNHHYAYKDKLVVKMDSDMNIMWNKIIPVDNITQIQSHGGMKSILHNDELYLFFPDDAENLKFWNGEANSLNEYRGLGTMGEEVATAFVIISPEGEVQYNQLQSPQLKDAYFMPYSSKLSEDGKSIQTIWFNQKVTSAYLKPGIVVLN